MKEQIIERLNETVKKSGDIECYMLVTDKSIGMNGSAGDILALICSAVEELSKQIPKDLLLESLVFALTFEENLEKNKAKWERISKLVEEMDGNE